MILLGIFIAVIISLMKASAQKHKGIVWLWCVIGIASYFVAQLIAGVFLGLLIPNALDNYLLILIVGLSSGIAGVFLARYILIYTHNNNNEIDDSINHDILDDESFEI